MADEPTPTPTPTDPKPTEPPAFAAITTQADLDRIIGGRIAREREKFADYEAIKAKAAEHDKAVEAAKTEAQKAVDAARAEGESAGRTAGNARLLNAEARALAATEGARNPAIAIGALDLSGVKVNDDGSVDADAIKAKLTALKESDPYLFAEPGQTRSTPRPDPTQGKAAETKGGALKGMSGSDLYDRLHPPKKAS